MKQAIIQALRAFIHQRPGLEPGNYGDWKAYRRESAEITRDLHQAERLLDQVAWRDSITAEDLIRAARSNYSGRLTIEPQSDGFIRIDYGTGQYFPTEFRKAACSILAGALWDYFWRNAPAPSDDHDTVSSGQYVRHTARRELGRTLARRWFDA